MLTSLGLAALLAIAGTFAAVGWTFLLNVAGLPGRAIAGMGICHGRKAVVRAGVALTFLIEAFLLLTFAALVVRTINACLEPRGTAPAWPLWIVGWYLASAPVLFGGKVIRGPHERDATDASFALALPLAGLAYWAFVLWPTVIDWGWGWVPTVRF